MPLTYSPKQLEKQGFKLGTDGLYSRNPGNSVKLISKPSKYKNKKVVHGTEVFDSMKEYRRFLVLKQMQDKGEITKLERQRVFTVEVNSKHICKYKSDFTYLKNGKLKVEDVKGYKKGMGYSYFMLKKKLVEALYNLVIEII